MTFPIVDILIVLILIVYILVVIYKGFWRSFISMFSVFITLILAILIAKPVSMLLQNWFHFSTVLGNSFHGSIESHVNAHGTGGWLGQAMNIIMGKEYMSHVTDNTVLVNDFSFKLGQICNILICAVVLYIIIRIVLLILAKLFKKITSNDIANGVDKSLGAVFGLIKGAVAVFILCGIMFELCSFVIPIGDWFNEILTHNKFTSLLYDWSTDILQNVILPFFVK